ncbi:13325_t:CDS:2 [Entrophospora sp. SA101]|nr:13325_t:CDS:2 [Entrophospora sp. SA101]
MNIFLIFLILLKCLFLVVNSAPTDPRLVHVTVIVNNNLYVMGGISNGLSSKEFFSLDLSQEFDVTTPPWKDLTETSPLPVSISWAKASSNTNNDTIFLFGGIMLDAVTGELNSKNVVYTHDFKSNQWLVNPPAFQGTAPETRREFASVSDPLTGKLYIHGGVHDVGITTGIFFNDFFFILDGNNLSWSQIGKTGASMPPPRIDHVAVLIANGLTLYDTKANTWDLMTTVGGLEIESRIGHTALYGNITNKVGPPVKMSNSIQILNIVDYKWVKSFPGLSPSSKTSTSSTSDSGLGPTTILAIVISVGFALIIATLVDQINNNDNLMRSISTTTPSLISSSNIQSLSNHNSQLSNTMDLNLQPGLERSTPGLNNIAIDQTHTNISTTDQNYSY